MKFMIGLNILYVKKVVLQIILIEVLQESKFVYIVLYPQKKYWLFTML